MHISRNKRAGQLLQQVRGRYARENTPFASFDPESGARSQGEAFQFTKAVNAARQKITQEIDRVLQEYAQGSAGQATLKQIRLESFGRDYKQESTIASQLGAAPNSQFWSWKIVHAIDYTHSGSETGGSLGNTVRKFSNIETLYATANVLIDYNTQHVVEVSEIHYSW